MSVRERNKFFAFQKEVANSATAYKPKYRTMIGRYLKRTKKVKDPKTGKVTLCASSNSGKVRRVFEVDGRGFNQLWETVEQYAYTAARRSHYSQQNTEQIADDVADVRYQLLYILRFFGPTPNGHPFSSYFTLAVMNTCQRNGRRRGELERRYKRKALIVDIINREILEGNRSPEQIASVILSSTEMELKMLKEEVVDMVEKYILSGKACSSFEVLGRQRTRRNVQNPESLFSALQASEKSDLVLVDVLPGGGETDINLIGAVPEKYHREMVTIGQNTLSLVDWIVGGEPLSSIARAMEIHPRTLKARLQKEVCLLHS